MFLQYYTTEFMSRKRNNPEEGKEDTKLTVYVMKLTRF